jgi:hypothetical protein
MNGVYQTAPKPHRKAVTAVDEIGLLDTGAAINSGGYRQCRFDVTLEGQGITGLELELLFYNARRGEWFGGARYSLDKPGRYALAAQTGGACVFLRVASFSGEAFQLEADYCLS